MGMSPIPAPALHKRLRKKQPSQDQVKGMVKTAQEDEGNLIKWDSTLKKHQEAHHAHSYAKIPLYPYLYLSFLPQSTGVLSHFSVCSKRLEIFSLVLDGRTCSLNIPPAVKLLLFGNYKTCLKRINLFLWLLRLLWSLSKGQKRTCTFIEQPNQLAGILKPMLFVN